MANPIAVPGTNVPSGAAVSPGGAQGPSAISANANNKATLGTDSLVLVQGTAAGVAATTHAQTVSGDDPQLTNARTPTAHQASHVTGSDQIPLASSSTKGLLNQTSGNTTDFIDGTNNSRPFGSLGQYYGTDTVNSAAYAVTVASDFVLTAGVTVYVTPSLSNNAANPTLNVNGTGAKPIVTRANAPLLYNSEIAVNRMFGVMYDGTSWRLITPIQRNAQFINVVNPVLECAGFDSVLVVLQVSSASGQGLSLRHLASGVPVTIIINNSTAGTNLYSVNATTPDGTAFGQVSWIWANSTTAGAALVNLMSAISQSASSSLMFQGMAQGATLFLK